MSARVAIAAGSSASPLGTSPALQFVSSVLASRAAASPTAAAAGYVVKGGAMSEVIDAVERVADGEPVLRRVPTTPKSDPKMKRVPL